MKLKQMKNILLLFGLSFINIFYCNCFRPDDEEEIRRLSEDLMKKKNAYSEKKGEEEIYILIMKGLIGIIIFFIIIIISCATYEIINCCMESKRELETKEIIAKKIQKSKNFKNFSLKLSNDSSSTDDDKKVSKVENSFHSSNISANNGVKGNCNNDSNNIVMEKPNKDDSNYCRPRMNSGNEAPIVQGVVNDNNNNNEYDNNNKEEKLLTNDGNVKNEDNLINPFEI